MEVYRFGFRAMGGIGEVVIACPVRTKAKDAATLAIEEVGRIERSYSRYRSGSIVSRINLAAGGEWVECDDETLSLFGYADSLYESSGGLFDITSGILRQAWDFSEPAVPDRARLDELIGKIGWDRVGRRGKEVRLPEIGMELDFGGFAKEYAADRAAALLHAHEVGNGYVNLSGDIRVIGPKPDGSPWVIGIRDPRDRDKAIASIPLTSGALATSGDYERFFELDGRRYCHILNPRTGMPVDYWQTVSVISPLAVLAGSCSTIAMLMEGDGLQYLNDSGMPFLAKDSTGHLHRKD
ncbi:MAG: FAD:protein FMN transferase [Chlorobiaceae bacterium]|nr:FAD:protein FMN transferase [Chlorobiaceae bacterium]